MIILSYYSIIIHSMKNDDKRNIATSPCGQGWELRWWLKVGGGGCCGGGHFRENFWAVSDKFS